MKSIKYLLFLILGLFMAAHISGQTITSSSGKFFKILKYPSDSPGVADSYYAQATITVSEPENIGKVIMQYRYTSNALKTVEYTFSTIDGKIFYECSGVQREVKHNGVVLEMDISNELKNWGSSGYNLLFVSVRNKTGSISSVYPAKTYVILD